MANRHIFRESHRKGEAYEQKRPAPRFFMFHLRWSWRDTWQDFEVVL